MGVVNTLGQHEESVVCFWSGAWGSSGAGIVSVPVLRRSVPVLRREGLCAAVAAAVSLMVFI